MPVVRRAQLTSAVSLRCRKAIQTACLRVVLWTAHSTVVHGGETPQSTEPCLDTLEVGVTV